MLMWSLKSFFLFTGFPWDLWILDGGLTKQDQQILEQHFPDAHIHLEPELRRRLQGPLLPYPQTANLRLKTTYAPAKKLIDAPLLLQDHKFLLIDSDVLFFQDPVELVRHLCLPDNDHFAFNMEKGQINSGVAIIPSGCVSLHRIEMILRSMSPAQRRKWTIEQDVYMALANERFKELSVAYAVEPVSSYDDLVSCHFIGVCRHRFYDCGVRKLRKIGFIDQLLESKHARLR